MTDELTTTDENPYQSPLPVEQDATGRSYPSARKAFLAGAKRGAKFGGKWVGLVLGSLATFVCVVMCATAGYIVYRFGYDNLHPPEGLLWAMVMVIVACAYTTLVAAIMSAIIMGIGEAVFYWRSRRITRTPIVP